jgi:hypothetical protein
MDMFWVSHFPAIGLVNCGEDGQYARRRILELLRWEAVRPEIDLFGLLFGYFLVRSAATNSKMGLNQPKNL